MRLIANPTISPQVVETGASFVVSVEVTEVDTSWEDIKNSFPTWQDLKDTCTTWKQVKQW